MEILSEKEDGQKQRMQIIFVMVVGGRREKINALLGKVLALVG